MYQLTIREQSWTTNNWSYFDNLTKIFQLNYLVSNFLVNFCPSVQIYCVYTARLHVQTCVSDKVRLYEIGPVDVVDRQTVDEVAVLVDGSMVRSTLTLVVVRTVWMFGITRGITWPRCGRLQRFIATAWQRQYHYKWPIVATHRRRWL